MGIYDALHPFTNVEMTFSLSICPFTNIEMSLSLSKRLFTLIQVYMCSVNDHFPTICSSTKAALYRNTTVSHAN